MPRNEKNADYSILANRDFWAKIEQSDKNNLMVVHDDKNKNKAKIEQSDKNNTVGMLGRLDYSEPISHGKELRKRISVWLKKPILRLIGCCENFGTKLYNEKIEIHHKL